MRFLDWQDELEAYFAGELTPLSSWLGAWGDRQSPQGVQTSASPPEPALAALRAVDTARRVGEALGELSRPHFIVLHAAYSPRTPHAWGMGKFRNPRLASVALTLPGYVLDVLRVERERRDAELERRRDAAWAEVRAAMRSGDAGRARAELELAPLLVRVRADPERELRDLVQNGREGRRILRRVETAAGRALREATAPYQAARGWW